MPNLQGPSGHAPGQVRTITVSRGSHDYLRIRCCIIYFTAIIGHFSPAFEIAMLALGLRLIVRSIVCCLISALVDVLVLSCHVISEQQAPVTAYLCCFWSTILEIVLSFANSLSYRRFEHNPFTSSLSCVTSTWYGTTLSQSIGLVIPSITSARRPNAAL